MHRKVIVYLYHPSSHPVIKNRVESILKMNSESFDARELYISKTHKNSLIMNMLELRLILKLIFGKKGIIHLFDFSFVFPLFIRVLEFRGYEIVYDTGNIHNETLALLGKKRFLLRIARQLEIKLLKYSDRVVSRGIFLSSRLNLLSKTRSEIFYIPDPVNVSTFSNTPLSKVILPFQKDDFIIGYSANFQNITIPNIGVLPRGWEIVDILSLLKENGVLAVKALFIGSGKGVESLIQYSKSRNVFNLCHFSGYVSKTEYVELLRKIDIGFMEDYDLPAYKSSIGSKVQDYMSAAKVVITGKTDEREFLLQAQHELDILFSPLKCKDKTFVNDYIREIYNKLNQVINNKEAANNYGKLNQDRAKQLFDLPIFNSKVQSLYKSFIK
ncbi:MAG: hypothetical protein B2I18_03895 [Cuniculiplasma sp. C_DKE]|nr:MAG: hypothetical protein B2I18_03895 [Cuniculiplasma sp. C_DKE]